MMMNLSDNFNCQLGSSEQHKESTTCRKERDLSDMTKPFCGDPAILLSLSTGISALKSVNVDDAINVGHKVYKKFFEYLLRISHLGENTSYSYDRERQPRLKKKEQYRP
jgi:hypothetical protein